MKINLIQHPQKVKRTVYKILNIFATIALIMNMSMVGVFLTPNEAGAKQTNDPKIIVGEQITELKGCELEIIKSVDKENAQPGETLTYTINYQNLAPEGGESCTGGGVRIDDVIPADLTYNGNHTETANTSYGYSDTRFTGTANPNPQAGDPIVSWNAHTLTPGESGTVTFEVTVNGIDQCTDTYINNTAWIYSNEISQGIESLEVVTHVVAECPLSSIQGRKYNDHNENGLHEMPGDERMDNWTIRLYEDDNSDWNFLEEKTTGHTNNIGQYRFDDLGLGTYYVCEVQKSDWTQTGPILGSNPVDFNGNPVNNAVAVTNLSGETDEGPVCWNVDITVSGTDYGWMKFGNHELPKPTITVTKNVEPDDSSNWDFTLDGPTPGSINLGDGDSHPFNDRTPGTYNLTEVTDPNYTMSVDCGNTPVNNITGGVEFELNTEDVSCTFTNTRNQGRVKIVKVLDDQSYPYLWSFDVPGYGPVDHMEWFTVDTNDYTVTETGPLGYTLTNATGICDNISGVTAQMHITTEGGVCFLYNNRDNGSVEVHKEYDYDGDGYIDENDPANWTWNIVGVESNIDAGLTRDILTNVNYSISENSLADYNSTWSCDNGLVGTGIVTDEFKVQKDEHVICTFSNVRKIGEVTFEKIVTSGPNDPSEWTFEVNGIFYNHDETATFLTDNYTVTEHGPDGYTNTNISGICSTTSITKVGSMTVTENGGTCTFTNTRDTGDIKVNKKVDLNGDGNFTEGNAMAQYLGFLWGIELETPIRIMGNTSGLITTGNYNVTENNIDGFHFVGWYTNIGDGEEDFSCENPEGTALPVNIDVLKDNTTEITLCNARDTGKLGGTKFNDLNENGIFDEGEPVIEGVVMNLSNGWTKTTDENGNYLFENLPTGLYDVEEVVPISWLNTTDNPVINVEVVANQTAYVNFGNAMQRVILDIDKSNDKNAVGPSETINYRVDWSVDGNSTAVNVVLTDRLPAEVIIDEASISDGGIYDAAEHMITWNFGNQEPGVNGFVTYTVTTIDSIEDGTVLVNTARISADNTDPKYKEDDTTVIVEIPVVLGEVLPKLLLTKSVDKTFINPGGTATYTVKVENIGEGDAINVQMQDLLPAGFTFEDGSVTKTWSLGDMGAGAFVDITYTVLVNENILAGTYDNLAVTWADNHGNVTDSEPVEVRIPIVLGEELPVTGGSAMAFIYFIIAGFILLFAGYVLRLTISSKDSK